VFITYYCILLANASVIAGAFNPRQEVFSAIPKRYVDNIEAFVVPLLGDFFREVVRICGYDDMDNLGFVEGVEKRFILLVEPRGVERHIEPCTVEAG
jgi:hypothetical protein